MSICMGCPKIWVPQDLFVRLGSCSIPDLSLPRCIVCLNTQSQIFPSLDVPCVSIIHVNFANCSFDKHGLLLIIFIKQHQHATACRSWGIFIETPCIGVPDLVTVDQAVWDRTDYDCRSSSVRRQTMMSRTDDMRVTDETLGQSNKLAEGRN